MLHTHPFWKYWRWSLTDIRGSHSQMACLEFIDFADVCSPVALFSSRTCVSGTAPPEAPDSEGSHFAAGKGAWADQWHSLSPEDPLSAWIPESPSALVRSVEGKRFIMRNAVDCTGIISSIGVNWIVKHISHASVLYAWFSKHLCVFISVRTACAVEILISTRNHSINMIFYYIWFTVWTDTEYSRTL